MKILAIETSCDETAAAVIESTDSGISILSNIVASQIEIHKKYGGVFPEIASRAHTEQIVAVIEESLSILTAEPSTLTPKTSPLADIDLIAVTAGPGLIGSLLVGVNAAKTLSFTSNKPIMPINHWLGHIYSTFAVNNSDSADAVVNGDSLSNKKSRGKATNHNQSQLITPRFPILALIVSGGHTGLVLMKSHTEIVPLGETLDDAAGEAFDKVAKMLELPYPGGPAISEEATRYKLQDTNKSKIPNIKFPRPMLKSGDYNFSFSGLKTSVLNKVRDLTTNPSLSTNHYSLSTIRPQIAFEFQQCVIDILITKTLQAAQEYKPKSICLCGGVSANKELREQMEIAINNHNLIHSNLTPITYHLPPLTLTGDNAAMIGIAAAYQIANGIKPTTYDKVNANSNLKLG